MQLKDENSPPHDVDESSIAEEEIRKRVINHVRARIQNLLRPISIDDIPIFNHINYVQGPTHKSAQKEEESEKRQVIPSALSSAHVLANDHKDEQDQDKCEKAQNRDEDSDGQSLLFGLWILAQTSPHLYF